MAKRDLAMNADCGRIRIRYLLLYCVFSTMETVSLFTNCKRNVINLHTNDLLERDCDRMVMRVNAET